MVFFKKIKTKIYQISKFNGFSPFLLTVCRKNRPKAYKFQIIKIQYML